jgi:hypothetical protein
MNIAQKNEETELIKDLLSEADYHASTAFRGHEDEVTCDSCGHIHIVYNGGNTSLAEAVRKLVEVMELTLT